MKLVITTPATIAVECDGIVDLRAEDASGSFGIRPGHADFLTVLVPSVVTYRARDGIEHFVAVRDGVLSVQGGHLVAVATPEAVTGDSFEAVEQRLAALMAAARESDSQARTDTARLHAAAIRQIQRTLEAGGARDG